MPKKVSDKSKMLPRIQVTDKPMRRIDPNEVAEALGADNTGIRIHDGGIPTASHVSPIVAAIQARSKKNSAKSEKETSDDLVAETPR